MIIFITIILICWIGIVWWGIKGSQNNELRIFNYDYGNSYVTLDFATFQNLYYKKWEAWDLNYYGLYYNKPFTVVHFKTYQDIRKYRKWRKKELQFQERRNLVIHQEKEKERLDEIMRDCGGDLS